MKNQQHKKPENKACYYCTYSTTNVPIYTALLAPEKDVRNKFSQPLLRQLPYAFVRKGEIYCNFEKTLLLNHFSQTIPLFFAKPVISRHPVCKLCVIEFPLNKQMVYRQQKDFPLQLNDIVSGLWIQRPDCSFVFELGQFACIDMACIIHMIQILLLKLFQPDVIADLVLEYLLEAWCTLQFSTCKKGGVAFVCFY